MKDVTRRAMRNQRKIIAGTIGREKTAISRFISQLTVRAKRRVIAERGYIDGKMRRGRGRHYDACITVSLKEDFDDPTLNHFLPRVINFTR